MVEQTTHGDLQNSQLLVDNVVNTNQITEKQNKITQQNKQLINDKTKDNTKITVDKVDNNLLDIQSALPHSICTEERCRRQ